MFIKKKTNFLLRIILYLAYASSALCETERLSPGAKECDHKGPTLFCDYKNAEKDLRIDTLTDKSIKKLFIYNVKTITVNETICVNMAFNNIARVTIQSGDLTGCDEDIEISVKNCTIDRLPEQVTKVYVEDSAIQSLTSEKILSKLIVINSNVSLADISKPMEEGISAVFQNSRIDKLLNLQIQNNASILFHKSVIDSAKPGSLVIHSAGEVIFRNSTISNLWDNSIVMHSEARVKFELCSDVIIKGTLKNQEICDDASKTSLTIFFIFLVLFLISLIFNIVCMVYILKSRKQSLRTINEVNGSEGNIETNNSTQLTKIENRSRGPPHYEVKSEIEPLLSQTRKNKEVDDILNKLENTVSKVQSSWETYQLKNKANCNHYLSDFNEKEKLKQNELQKTLAKLQDNKEQVISKEKDRKISSDEANSKMKDIEVKMQSETQKLTNNIEKEKANCNEKLISNYKIIVEKTCKIKELTFAAWQEILLSISNVINSSTEDNDSLKRLQYLFEKYCSEIKRAYDKTFTDISTQKTSAGDTKPKDPLKYKLKNQEALKDLQKNYVETFDEEIKDILKFQALLISIVNKMYYEKT